MSDIKFACPHCQQPFSAPDEMVGQLSVCPNCKQSFKVPVVLKDEHSTDPNQIIQMSYKSKTSNGKFHVLLTVVSVVMTILFMSLFKGLFEKIKFGSSSMPAFFCNGFNANGKYEPTKLEWGVCDMRFDVRHERSPNEPYWVDIVARNENDEISILVIYDPGCNMELVRQHVDFVRNMINANIRKGSYGWGPWIKITETIRPSKSK